MSCLLDKQVEMLGRQGGVMFKLGIQMGSRGWRCKYWLCQNLSDGAKEWMRSISKRLSFADHYQ